MLKIQNIRQSFKTGFWLKEAEILKGINFEIPKGTIYGFLGHNGAGKTTLIHLIVGIRRAVSGEITLEGQPVHLPEVRAQMGYLPERPYFYETLTGKNLLRYYGELSNLDANTIKKRTPEVLEAVGLSHAGDLELRKYSKGMLQRIGVAQSILHNPKFLVLDEPMSGLDPLGRKSMRELIQDLASQGRTIFFSSHIIPDVEMICDHLAVIRKGELIGAGPISQFLESQKNEVEIFYSQPNSSVLQKRMVSDQKSVNLAIEELMRDKADIRSVQPVRRSLEEVFE